MLRRRKTKPVDTVSTHRYVGPSTKYGLAQGVRCCIRGRGPCGMLKIHTADNRSWLVLRGQLEKL